MSFKIENFAQDGREFINNVALAINTPGDEDRAYRTVKAVFSALRERISPEESLHLVSQLPMMVKALYVDGWKLSTRANTVDRLEEFLDSIRAHSSAPAIDWGNDQAAARTLRQVIGVIRDYTGQGELDDIAAQLPESIAALFEPVQVL